MSLTVDQVCWEVVRVINGEDSNHLAYTEQRKWPYRFAVLELGDSRQLVEIRDDDVVTFVPDDCLAARVLLWLSTLDQEVFRPLEDKLKKIVKTFKLYATPLAEDKIKRVRWRDDPGLTLRRLPWDRPLAQEATPTWDKIIGLMSNREAFMAFIGSTLFDDSYEQQYFFGYGGGSNGKGCINRFLERVFGPSYVAKRAVPESQGSHWTSDLIGKRVCVFADENNQKFMAGTLFKMMTGGDPIPINPKGKPMFNAKLHIKYFVFSNERPSITAEDSDLRRVIYSEFKKRKGKKVDPIFEDKLWSEGAAFLYRCLETYQQLCPTHGPIRKGTKMIRTHIENEVEIDLETVLTHAFFVIPKAQEGADWVTGEALNLRLMQEGMTREGDRSAFRRYLENKYDIIRVTDPNNKNRKVYLGLTEKVQR